MSNPYVKTDDELATLTRAHKYVNVTKLADRLKPDTCVNIPGANVVDKYSCSLYCIYNGYNKFYIIQLLKAPNEWYYLYTRYGENGNAGGHSITKVCGDGAPGYSNGVKMFKKQFKQKFYESWDLTQDGEKALGTDNLRYRMYDYSSSKK